MGSGALRLHGGEGNAHFPWAFFILVLSFSLILFIEKIATDHGMTHHDEKKSIILGTSHDENSQYLVEKERKSLL